MHWLNYHHLLYFWTVVREGTVSAAAEKLFVSQSTVSGQLRELERTVGEKLLEKKGRRLVLTETGRMVADYAGEIFSTGQELMDRLRGDRGERTLPFLAGVPDVMPKLIVSRLLEPVFGLAEKTRLVCREASLGELLADLTQHRLDMVFSDSQYAPPSEVRLFHHLLGGCGIDWFGSDGIRERCAGRFPQALDSVPVILPTDGTLLRGRIEQWFRETGVRPNIVAEVEDSALMKNLAARGFGVVPVASAVAADAARLGLHRIGTADGARLHFYLITLDRKITHPAVQAIIDSAGAELFGETTLP